MKRKLLLTLAASLLAMPAIARDFEYTYEGQTLTYTVLDETSKTCEVGSYNDDIRGNLIIPAAANDGTTNYDVTSISYRAFDESPSLRSIRIPYTIVSISSSWLTDYNYGLREISVDDANKFYASIDGVLYDKNIETIHTYPASKDGASYSLPNTVKYIGQYAFRGSKIMTICIPNSVESIGHYAFRECNLSSVVIPNSVTSIGDGAFRECSNLISVEIPNSVTSIGSQVFKECTKMSSVVIPNSITTINYGMFESCSALTSIEIPNSVTNIGPNAFNECMVLESVNIPNTVKTIGSYAFNHCMRFTDVEIPDSVIEIGDYAFNGCKNLRSVRIGSSVKWIGDYAFSGWNCLTSIYCMALTPPTCSTLLPFGTIDQQYTLYVHDSALDAYKKAKMWSDFINIVGIVTSKNIIVNGVNYIIDLSNHTATVTYAEQNSLSNYEGMQSVVIPETVEYEGESYTVTGIGEEAFNNCWGIKSVTMPSTLQSIGKLAFGYCTSLRSVVIPDEVTIIDDEAFTGCSALASVTIGGTVETIGDYAFFGCTGLSSINVPESVKNIGENAFMGVHWINEVHAESEVPAEAPVSAFSTNAYRNATLVVPDGALSTYKSHPTWSNFLAIREEGNSTTDIMVVEGAIIVRGADSVRIYNPSGVQIYSGKSGRIELPSGIYLVVTDSVSRKVRL